MEHHFEESKFTTNIWFKYLMMEIDVYGYWWCGMYHDKLILRISINFEVMKFICCSVDSLVTR